MGDFNYTLQYAQYYGSWFMGLDLTLIGLVDHGSMYWPMISFKFI